MMGDDLPAFLSGDLRICPAIGQVANAAGASIRLGPVNMKVLEALLTRAGSVVSRAELYDVVWRNQAVGEDALTRCISDIRAELRTLSDREDWIETLPKRGYRWVGGVREIRLSDHQPRTPALASPSPDASDVRSHPIQRRAFGLVGRGLGYLVALVTMASLLVWAIDRFSGTRVPVVAVLPVSAGPVQGDVAAELDLELTRYLMSLEQLDVLSRTAIEARPANPFPFFYYEFGARWLVESELREVSGHPFLTINVADARTGIVQLQVTEPIVDSEAGAGSVPVGVLSALSRFLESEPARAMR